MTTVVDLYAGAGLFSVLMADDVGPTGSVLAVERDRRACADAEHNGHGRSQLRVRQASITPNLVEHGIGRPDLLVLDPAREGAGKGGDGGAERACDHPAAAGLRVVRPIVVQPGPARPAGLALDPHRRCGRSTSSP